jgi:hypothetical protein
MSLRFRSDIACTDTEDGTVLLDERTGHYWQLNISGALVLRHLLDGDDPDQIAQRLATHYHIDVHRARADIDAIATQLRHEGLVEPA